MRAEGHFRSDNWSSIFTTMFFVMVLVYFSYHAISGDRGFLALLQLSQKVDQMQMELDLVRAERMRLEHRVERMRQDSLDLDLLDEQARRTLGYASPDEKVYNTDR